MMLWYVLVAAVVAATEAQVYRYDGTGTLIVDDDDVFSVVQPVVAAPASQPELPAPQPVAFLAAPRAAPQVVLHQQGLPHQTFHSFFPSSLIHASHQSRSYHLSWLHHPGRTYTHQQAVHYCNSLNHFGVPFHFEVLKIDDLSELRFIISLLNSHGVSAVWTRDTIHTAAYSIRQYINRSGSSNPGEDCLSVEGGHHSIWLHQDRCSHWKLVICETHITHGKKPHWNA